MEPIASAMNHTGIFEGSSKKRVAYLEDLIPEEGCFEPKSGFTWNQYVVLDAGIKSGRYDLKTRISDEAKELITGGELEYVNPQVQR